MSGRLLKISWVLALLALAGALAFAVAKVGADRPFAQWTPRVGEPVSVPLVMAAPTPADLTATAPCSGVRAAPEGAPNLVLGTSGSAINEQALRVLSQGSRIWAEFGGNPVSGASLELPADDCTLRINYSGAGNTLTLAAGQASGSGVPVVLGSRDPQVPPAVVSVTGLSTTPGLLGKLDVRVSSATIGHDVPGWRPLLGALVLLCGVVVIALRYRRDRVIESGAETSVATPRWTGSDTLVAVAVAVGLVLSLPDFDDGWVLTTVREYTPLRVFSNYYQNQATAQPQGFWWAWLQQLWLVPTGTPAFLLRLPAALLGIGGWWLLRRRVIDQALPAGSLRLARLAGAFVVIAAVPSLVLLLRPEPVVAVLVAATLALCVRYAQRPDPWVLGVMALLCALALSVHQTGWSVVLASLSVTPAVLRWAKSAERPWTQLLPLIIGPLAVFVVLLLAGSNVWLWWESVGNFTQDGSYSSVLDEVTRLHGLTAGFSAVPSRVLFFGVAIMGLLAYLVRSPDLRVGLPRAAGLAASLAVLGLALTADKLPSHAAAVVPAVALLMSMAVADLGFTRARGTRLVVGLVGAVIISYLATRITPLATFSWEEVPSAGPGAQSWWSGGWVALVVAVTAIVAGWLSWRRRRVADASAEALRHGASPGAVESSGTDAGAQVDDGDRARRTLLWGVGVAVGLTVAASFMPTIVQGSSSVSWLGQNLSALQGEGCGLAGDAGVKVPAGVVQLPVVPRRPGSPAEATVTPGLLAMPVGAGTLTEQQVETPIPDVQVLAAPIGGKGAVTTFGYQVPVGGAVTLWALSGAGPLSLELDYRDSAGAALGTRMLTRNGELNTWQAFSVVAPDGAAEISARWFSDSGPIAITAPQRVLSTASVAQLVGSDPAWNNPQTHLQAACLPMPSIRRGIVAPFSYSVGRPILNGRGYLSEVPAGQLACAVEQPDAASRCIYRLGTGDPGGLAIRPHRDQVGWL